MILHRTLFDHLACDLLHTQPHCLGIHVHDHVPVVFIDIHEEPGFVQTRVKDANIDGPESCDSSGHGCGVVFTLGDIHLDGNRLAIACGIDLVCDVLGHVEI